MQVTNLILITDNSLMNTNKTGHNCKMKNIEIFPKSWFSKVFKKYGSYWEQFWIKFWQQRWYLLQHFNYLMNTIEGICDIPYT